MNLEQTVVAIQPAKKKRRAKRSGKTHVTQPTLWARISKFLTQRLRSHSPRRLRLCETVALGDKRFVAVVEFENRRFLLAGAPQSVTLLTELQDRRFAAGLKKQITGSVEAE
jgi:flagellar biogenesis protein FliO